MEENETLAVDRETLLSLRSLVDSMLLCLRGLESRFRKEIEMIGAVGALGDKALDLLNKHLEIGKGKP